MPVTPKSMLLVLSPPLTTTLTGPTSWQTFWPTCPNIPQSPLLPTTKSTSLLILLMRSSCFPSLKSETWQSQVLMFSHFQCSNYHKIQNILVVQNFFLYSSLSSVQLLSPIRLYVTPWTAAHQSSLSITNSWSLLKLMSIESVMPSNHLILCHPLLLLPSIFSDFMVFSNESVLIIRWQKYWSFSFGISPSWIFKVDFL